jgi:hypothetical protein
MRLFSFYLTGISTSGVFYLTPEVRLRTENVSLMHSLPREGARVSETFSRDERDK